MEEKMGDITKLAYEACSEEDRILQQFPTADAVLDYLYDDTNFKSLSQELKEIMIKNGICSKDDPDSSFVDALHERLCSLDKSLNRDNSRKRSNINNWFDGTSNSIGKLRDAIEICFALDLDYKLAKEFLNKCGFYMFNFRDASEVTYLYCLLAHRPLSAADSIIAAYNSAEYEPIYTTKESHEHSGDTTKYFKSLFDLTEGSNWSDDDSFLNSFLIPNKQKFISHSETCFREYIKLKNYAYLKVLLGSLENENADTDVVDDFIDNIKVYAEKDEFFSKLNSKMFLDIKKDKNKEFVGKDNLPEICEALINYTLDNLDNINIQQTVYSFLAFLPPHKVLSSLCEAIIGNHDNGRGRQMRQSKLYSSVLFKFPDRHKYYVKDPSELHSGVRRKMMIFLFYIAYAYELNPFLNEKLGDSTFTPRLFGEDMGFDNFFKELNDLLDRCMLAPLYPANQFDWLILISLRQFELFTDDISDDPLQYFNEVIKQSFPNDDD